jgi:uncharacterized membrane protein
MRTIINLAAAVFLLAVTIGIFFWAQSLAGGAFNFDERQQMGFVMPIISALLMLCGVLFGALYAELQRDDQRPLTAVAQAFQKPSLYRALLVAPIVFAGVYAFAQSNSDGIIVAIFAFQNGFFCESIFRKSAAAREAGPAAA